MGPEWFASNKCSGQLIELRRVFRVNPMLTFRKNMEPRARDSLANDPGMKRWYQRILLSVQNKRGACDTTEFPAVNITSRVEDRLQAVNIAFPQATKGIAINLTHRFHLPRRPR